jgi:GR25 family glycosyltransferase involved in LPS biosynthesis
MASRTERDAQIDARLDRIGQHQFRAKFHLRGRDRATAEQRGEPTIRRHAAELIGKRLTPAQPVKDGRQTPYRGHPVFVAQHATATCCRTCLERWHDIPKGRELTPAEQAYVVEVICRWIGREFRTSVS